MRIQNIVLSRAASVEVTAQISNIACERIARKLPIYPLAKRGVPTYPNNSVDQKMSIETFAFKGRSYTALVNLSALVLAPIFMIGACIYGTYLHGWKMFLATAPFAALLGCFAVFMLFERARMRKSTVSIDTTEGLIVFRHFRFSASFLPEKPRNEERVRFDEVIAVDPIELSKGIMGIEIRTTKGKVRISEEMERFTVLASALETIANANTADKAVLQQAVAAEPKIHTAWYGWVILAAGVGLVLYLGWKFMYAE